MSIAFFRLILKKSEFIGKFYLKLGLKIAKGRSETLRPMLIINCNYAIWLNLRAKLDFL